MTRATRRTIAALAAAAWMAVLTPMAPAVAHDGHERQWAPSATEAQSSLATLPAPQVLPGAKPQTTRVQIHGMAVGRQVLSRAGDETLADYAFSERGRGDQIRARWSLDARGLPLRYEAEGNDYWKVPLTERFERTEGAGAQASWKNRVEQGHRAWPEAGAFYLPANAPPEFTAVLARALLKAPGQRLALLPAGEATIAKGATIAAGGRRLTMYRISGIDFTPVPVWLDERLQTAAVVDDWFEVLEARDAALLPRLVAAQRDADQRWSADLARRLTHVPAGDLLIRHARLFDPRDGVAREDMRVLVRGGLILRVEPDDASPAPPDTEVLDAEGRFLMPGLWDVHQHFAGTDGVFDLIAGVTSARDMANDNLPLIERVRRFDAGTELGPRVVKAGIVEGVGPLAGPTDVRVETLDRARQAVDWYAERGYAQIKIYSSFKPELVRPIADLAHARGMRVSGHVPAFMRAQQFVEAGSDEIQHLNFIVLNFFPEVADTRGKDRYTVMAEKLLQLDLDSAPVTGFIAELRRRHTVLDPTVAILEGLYSGAPGEPPAALRGLVERFPPIVRRRLLSGAVAVPPGKEEAYRQALPRLLELIRRLHDGGVTLMPGTDAFAGYTLHRELALYVRAGIPNAEVLRLATLTPAEVLGVAGQRGVIAAGKQADMVLLDGDPLTDIAALGQVHRTIKAGRVFDPAQLEAAMGMTR
ncbi:amidohydrolase family protein [Roseateles sp. So40a]|uniref:amidohydrolase family protein n=1 Tax=Roseateles sp. So40a TaxID=3400226 RepID=UPI003A8599F7